MNIRIVENTNKETARRLSDAVAELVRVSENDIVDNASDADLIVSLGGDGTLLQTWHNCGRLGTPIFGINCGHLGYLTEGTLSDWNSKLRQILWDKDYSVKSRMTLRLKNEDLDEDEYFALNEFNISRCGNGLFEYCLFVIDSDNPNQDKIHLLDCKADGVICATPTGATAYALSAGGSFIDPNTRVIEVVPVCPHSLLNRSIVFSENSKIVLVANSRGVLYADGNRLGWVNEGDEFVISQSDNDMKLAVVDEESFMSRISKNFV